MKKLITAAFILAATSAFADYNTVTHFTWDTDTNGNTACYASDINGVVNAGEQPSTNNCCAGSYNTVTHFTWDTDSNGNTGCYASNSNGAVNGGEQPSSNECCAN